MWLNFYFTAVKKTNRCFVLACRKMHISNGSQEVTVDEITARTHPRSIGMLLHRRRGEVGVLR